jgi:hypothetical protein
MQYTTCLAEKQKEESLLQLAFHFEKEQKQREERSGKTKNRYKARLRKMLIEMLLQSHIIQQNILIMQENALKLREKCELLLEDVTDVLEDNHGSQSPDHNAVTDS